MALSSSIVWEVRTSATASNANGGGFKTGASGTDYSQQDAAQYNLTGVTTAAADAILLHASAAAVMVGNIAHITGGTNFTIGWYEIISVVAGVSITLDRNCTTAAGAAGVVNIGGALSMASTLDDDAFEACVAGNIWYIKAGTYALGEGVAVSVGVGTAASPVKIYGYQTTRGDNPTGTNRPLFALGANTFTPATYWHIFNMRFTGTGTNVLAGGSENVIVNCKANNSSTTSARNALNTGGGDSFLFNCEGQSNRGRGFGTGARISIFGNFLHDSNVGCAQTSTSQTDFSNNIISACRSAAIAFTGAATSINTIKNNTLYGYETPTGIGISLATGNQNIRVLNNIIYGFATGVDHADTQTEGFDDYNDYFNNTADVSAAGEWQKGDHDVATNPAFTSVSEVSGTAGAFAAAGSKLVDTTKNFTALGVVAGQDFVYIVSGTGVTLNTNDYHYAISSISTTTNPNDTLNLDSSPGTDATADKVYRITIGHNFAISGAI